MRRRPTGDPDTRARDEHRERVAAAAERYAPMASDPAALRRAGHLTAAMTAERGADTAEVLAGIADGYAALFGQAGRDGWLLSWPEAVTIAREALAAHEDATP